MTEEKEVCPDCGQVHEDGDGKPDFMSYIRARAFHKLVETEVKMLFTRIRFEFPEAPDIECAVLAKLHGDEKRYGVCAIESATNAHDGGIAFIEEMLDHAKKAMIHVSERQAAQAGEKH